MSRGIASPIPQEFLSDQRRIDSFFAKVKRGDGCWLWTAYANDKGYGSFRLYGRPYPAHRLSYALHKGPPLPNLMVCHSCDNPRCVNPSHLWLGTAKDNIADMLSKGRRGRRVSKITHCPRGHEYSEENTWTPKNTNFRNCKKCGSISALSQYYKRKRLKHKAAMEADRVFLAQ